VVRALHLEGDSLLGTVFTRRRDPVLEWLDRLRLPSGARVLEVGCGSGVLAVQLAGRGLQVDAVDLIPAMFAATRHRADDAGVGAQLEVHAGDAMRLDYADDSFAVVIAVAVPPVSQALAEIARVLAPGGHAIVTAANPMQFDLMLRASNLEPVANTTLGSSLARRLQRLAERCRPPVREGGANYMVLARSFTRGQGGSRTLTGVQHASARYR
jgi:ubiquinone/menaquinone biosynthesis C-methylase UbiE